SRALDGDARGGERARQRVTPARVVGRRERDAEVLVGLEPRGQPQREGRRQAGGVDEVLAALHQVEDRGGKGGGGQTQHERLGGRRVAPERHGGQLGVGTGREVVALPGEPLR